MGEGAAATPWAGRSSCAAAPMCSRTGDIGLICGLGRQRRRRRRAPDRGADRHAPRASTRITCGELAKAASAELKVPLEEMPARIAQLLDERQAARARSVRRARRSSPWAAARGADGADGVRMVGDVKLMARAVDGIDIKDLKSLADEGKKQVGSGVVAIVGVTDGWQGRHRGRRDRRSRPRGSQRRRSGAQGRPRRLAARAAAAGPTWRRPAAPTAPRRTRRSRPSRRRSAAGIGNGRGQARRQGSPLDHGPWLKDVLVFLAAAGIIVPLFHRARIGAVLGFLLVGLAVGPYGFGRLVGDLSLAALSSPSSIATGSSSSPSSASCSCCSCSGWSCRSARLWSLRRYRARHRRRCSSCSPRSPIGARRRARSARASSSAMVLGLCLAHVLDRDRDAAARGRKAAPPRRSAASRSSVLLFQDLMVAPVLFGVGSARPRRAARRAGARGRATAGGGRGRGDHRGAAARCCGRCSVLPATPAPRLIMAITLFIVIALRRRHRQPGFERARRLPRRPAADGDRVPPPDRARSGAVQGSADRPVLHHRRNADRSRDPVAADRLDPSGRVVALLARQGRHPVCGDSAVRVAQRRCDRGRDPAGAGR